MFTNLLGHVCRLLPSGSWTALRAVRESLVDTRAVRVDPLLGNTLGSTGDGFVIAEWVAEVGDHWIAPLHVHESDDEAWYVLEGTMGFRLGEDEVEAPAGCAAYARRGTPHTYRNAADVPARYLLVMTPRIASLIDEIHRPGVDVAAVFAAHHSRLVAERPGEGAGR